MAAILGLGLAFAFPAENADNRNEDAAPWTASAKLAPSALIAPGLSVHYSGGSGLPDDVKAWLESQGIPVRNPSASLPSPSQY